MNLWVKRLNEQTIRLPDRQTSRQEYESSRLSDKPAHPFISQFDYMRSRKSFDGQLTNSLILSESIANQRRIDGESMTNRGRFDG